MLGTLPSFVNQPECATDIQDVTGDDFRGLDLNHDRIFRLDGGRLGGQPVRDVRRHVGEKRRQLTFGNFQLLSARQTVSGFSALNPSFSYD